MAEWRPTERQLNLGLVALLVGLGALSFDRALRGRYDFHHFYLDARYVWEHGELNPEVVPFARSDEERQLPFYLPAVPLALAPFAALGRQPAALLWSAAQVAALGYSLSVLRRWGGDVGERRRLGFTLAIVLAIPAFIEAARFNQLSYFVLALVLAGFRTLDRGRPWSAGAVFAAAAVLKLLPLIFLPWLVLKRRWSAAAGFAVASVVLTLLPPLVAFGPQKTLEYHRQWWQHNVQGNSAGGLLDMGLPEHFINHRNQSITQVLTRWTWPGHRFATPWQPLHLAPETCQRLAYGVAAVIAALLLWTTRRAWLRLVPERRQAEFGAYALGMLVFSPLLRQYYLVWAVPALVVLAPMALAPSASRARRLARAGVGVWAVGMVAWIEPLTRLHGAHLAMLVVMGVLLLGAAHASRTRAGSVSTQPRF